MSDTGPAGTAAGAAGEVESPAARRWREALAGWGIPDEILAQAPESPWSCPVAAFRVTGDEPVTPSHVLAMEALPQGGSVLDVGAGGGAMSRPLRARGARIVAVDASEDMLAVCDADVRVQGRWPDVAGEVETVDVTVCGNVAYNVPDLAPFALALGRSARSRVVLELTVEHPRATADQRAFWRHFWGLERPTGPVWEDALAVLREAGLDPGVEIWERPSRFAFDTLDDLVAVTRRQLCLPASRDGEMREQVLAHAVQRDGRWHARAAAARVVTLWWDTGGAGIGG